MADSCLLARYHDFLPITPNTPLITLGEGNTPLVRSQRLEGELGCGELYFKLEGCNPSGSFKDRGMVLAVAKALEAKSTTLLCASTGNTSASAAAYGARCGLATYVLVPKGNVALGKLAQAITFGARVLVIDGTFDQALQIARSQGHVPWEWFEAEKGEDPERAARLGRSLAGKYPVTLVNSINPYRLEGQKTAAFEIVDALGEAPDFLFIPVGNAGNITAYWKGFSEYQRAARAKKTPRMMGFEAEGAAPIVKGRVIENPKTIASAICIGNPASWKGALAARDESGGLIDCVSDEEILAAYKLLAAKEGIFGEPASAAGVAGLAKLVKKDQDFRGKRVVCVITGTGLKDPDTALHIAPPLTELPADLVAIEKALGWA